jgi:hypothetical protein
VIGTYIKIGAAIALLAALGWLGRAIYSAGEQHTQLAWDAARIIEKSTYDAAVAQATKERDAALATNEAISNDYQIKLDAANSNAADFAQRLRNATARIYSNQVSKAGDRPAASDPSAPSSAGQLGQLVTLVTDLRTECKANSDQLDALIAEVKPWLGDAAPVR